MPFNKIAVISDRPLALGFKVLGIKDVFIVNPKTASETLINVINKHEHDLVMAEDTVKQSLSSSQLRMLETVTQPIVIFIPTQTTLNREESVRDLAKRVLGFDILEEGKWKAQ